MNASNFSAHHNDPKPRRLTAEQVEQINRVFASLGDYGEIHLIIQHGELRYVNKVESHKAWKESEETDSA